MAFIFWNFFFSEKIDSKPKNMKGTPTKSILEIDQNKNGIFAPK
jgi:hypothetical protein